LRSSRKGSYADPSNYWLLCRNGKKEEMSQCQCEMG
jgi:hypothetical protein